MSSLTLLQSLHESLSTRAQVTSAFGAAIVAGDKTIIPVAKIAYGFGGVQERGVEIKQRPWRGWRWRTSRVAPSGWACSKSVRRTSFCGCWGQEKLLGTLLLGAALGPPRKRR